MHLRWPYGRRQLKNMTGQRCWRLQVLVAKQAPVSFSLQQQQSRNASRIKQLSWALF